LIAARLGIARNKIADLWKSEPIPAPGDELSGIYQLIVEKLKTD
jgi:hypothetical protein